MNKVNYVTNDRFEKINEKNKRLWDKFLISKMSLSENTKYAYTKDIMQLFTYILLNCDNKYILDIKTEDVADVLDDFIAMSYSVLGNKEKRIARRLSTISSFYLYLKKKRLVKENPVELLERPKINKQKFEIKQVFLNSEQVEIIRNQLDNSGELQLNLFFNLGIYTMARVNALSNIKISDIDIDKRRIYNVIEKEGYNVTLLIDDRCKQSIVDWLKYRENNNIKNEYLFITRYSGEYKQASKNTMQTIWIKKIGEIINEPDLHCHDLRHSGSNLRYQKGMKLEDVSKLLNHKGTQVTQDHYLKTNFDKLQSEMDKYEI